MQTADLIREEQALGHLVAMNTGTQVAREAGNMVDLDSIPTKLIEVVETGKQLLMALRALTTSASPTAWSNTSPSCPPCSVPFTP